MTKVLSIVLLVMVAMVLGAGGASVAAGPGGGVTLTVLHTNDGRSMLLNAGEGLEDYGGVARLMTLIDIERAAASSGEDDIAVVVSAGDEVLAGPQFQASMAKGVPFYESVVARLLGYDAMVLGNHEFDFGPEALADYLCGLVMTGGGATFPSCGKTGRTAAPIVATNLDFSGEPELQEFVDGGAIVKSTVVVKGGHRVGIVGATTPMVRFVSSPRDVKVDPRLAPLLQAEVDRLEAQGIDKIVAVTHLDGIEQDLDLATQVSGVDVIVAGGGGELLANPGDLLVPGDRPSGDRPYPVYATGRDGTRIPVVTTPGSHKYLGRLVVEFDDKGNVVSIDPSSGPIRVAGPEIEDGVRPDQIVTMAVDRPLSEYLNGLAQTVIATTEVALDGNEAPGLQTRETNLGNLVADAALWQANALAAEYGAQPASVALINGGAILEHRVLQPGTLTLLNTYEIAPFPSFISIVEEVSPHEFKRLMENGVSALPRAHGRFPQIAGFRLVYDPVGEPMTFGEAGNVLSEGARVVEIQLDEGTYIVRDGTVVPGAPSVNIATLNFTALGGDQYPFESDFVNVGTSYRDALENYVKQALGGVIGEAQYPERGAGRILVR